MSLTIDRVHVFISIDENGDEGVIGKNINGVFSPFVCADQARVEFFRPHAQEIARMSGKKVKLIQLSLRTNIEEIK